MASKQVGNSLDSQINDYLLTASGHLKENKLGIELRQAAAYGAAAGSALVMMSQAEASVVHNAGTTPRPVTATASIDTPGPSYNSFDMNGDGVNDFALFAAFSYSRPSYYSAGINGTPGAANNFVLGGTNSSTANVRKLSSGVTIGPNAGALAWQSAPSTLRDVFFNSSSGASNWYGTSGEIGYAGVRFKIGANTHYGWILLRLNNDGNLSATEWAYESCPNTAIQAGAISGGPASCAVTPVPVMGLPALGLTGLALGGMGLAGLRRRRQGQGKSPQL